MRDCPSTARPAPHVAALMRATIYSQRSAARLSWRAGCAWFLFSPRKQGERSAERRGGLRGPRDGRRNHPRHALRGAPPSLAIGKARLPALHWRRSCLDVGPRFSWPSGRLAANQPPSVSQLLAGTHQLPRAEPRRRPSASRARARPRAPHQPRRFRRRHRSSAPHLRRRLRSAPPQDASRSAPHEQGERNDKAGLEGGDYFWGPITRMGDIVLDKPIRTRYP